MLPALLCRMVQDQADKSWQHRSLTDRKITRLNSIHHITPYAFFSFKKQTTTPFHLILPTPNTDNFYLFFVNDTATTEIYTLSLHDALPIFRNVVGQPISTFFGYKVVGLFQSASDVASSPLQDGAGPGR